MTEHVRLTATPRLVFGRDRQLEQDLVSWKREHNPAEVDKYNEEKRSRAGLTLWTDPETLKPTDSVRAHVIARDRGCRLVTGGCTGEIDARYINEATGRTMAPFDVHHSVALCDFHDWELNRQNPRGLEARRIIRAILGLRITGTHEETR